MLSVVVLRCVSVCVCVAFSRPTHLDGACSSRRGNYILYRVQGSWYARPAQRMQVRQGFFVLATASRAVSHDAVFRDEVVSHVAVFPDEVRPSWALDFQSFQLAVYELQPRCRSR